MFNLIGDLADGLSRQMGAAQSGLEEMLFEPVIRLGVTGLSRSGKTVFITSLVANLINQGRMSQVRAVADGRLEMAYLQPQPNDSIARFAYEDHLAALTGPAPHWPESTRSISQLRVSLKVRPSGLLSGLSGPRTVHLDIIDYPGEWLLDLPLLSQDYAAWSAAALSRAQSRASLAEGWLAQLEGSDPLAKLEEPTAQALASAFTAHLRAAREAGFSDCAPGRFLMPGDLEGSPALTFAPLPKPAGKPRSNSLYAAFERRFESYKRIVVKPFFRDHFSRLDRQIVLVDVLGAINAGPQAIDDLRGAMADILKTFKPGANSFLAPLLGTKVERILFAATKADHLHHTQHPQLTALVEALLAEARARADYAGARTKAISLAALRATTEKEVQQAGQTMSVVQGRLLESGKHAALFAGDLPSDPAHLLAPARAGAQTWLDRDFSVMRFAPPVLTLAPGQGPPHIRLDRAVEFLIGDKI
ncbi:MAG: YcjX family protein [Pseudomonadota bacterium]